MSKLTKERELEAALACMRQAEDERDEAQALLKQLEADYGETAEAYRQISRAQLVTLDERDEARDVIDATRRLLDKATTHANEFKRERDVALSELARVTPNEYGDA